MLGDLFEYSFRMNLGYRTGADESFAQCIRTTTAGKDLSTVTVNNVLFYCWIPDTFATMLSGLGQVLLLCSGKTCLQALLVPPCNNCDQQLA